MGLAALLLTGCAAVPTPPSLVVGATPDAESLVLAHLYAGALRGSGVAAYVEMTHDPISRLDSGTLTVVPGFTGRLLEAFAPGVAARSDRQVYWAMVGALPEGIAAGDYAMTAADKPALAVTKPTAADWGGTGLSELPRHCESLVLGGLAGVRAPSTVGRCRLPKVREFPDNTALFAALRGKQISAAWTSTADPDIPGDSSDIVVLTDGRPALVRAENVVPLYRRNEVAEPQLLAINQVAGVLDTAALADMRRQVGGGADPQTVADAWLAEHPLGR
ncbi:MAG: glycine betaine ABC transporter substrate-binding protein [Mycobacterium sp.]